MKKLGLIGGVGPESTIEYYRFIIKQFQDRLGTRDYPELIIHSVNMTEMLGYVFNNHLDKLVDFLADKVKALEHSGADFGAIASNTPHLVFDRLAQGTKLPLVSIVEETCKAVSSSNIRRVALLGTKSTMTGGFYNRVAARFGIEVVIPDPEAQDYIHDKYMTELLFNNIRSDTKQHLIRIVSELMDRKSIQGLILGGTELPLILQKTDFSQLVVFDTTQIHVKSLVNKMIEA